MPPASPLRGPQLFGIVHRLWTDLFDRDESIHKVFRSIITQLGPPLESGSQPKAIRLAAKTKTKES